MKALVWKDFRNNQSLLVIGIGLFLLPLLVVVSVMFAAASSAEGSPTTEEIIGALALVTWGSMAASIALSQLTLLFLGGQMFAGERASQTAQFLLYQPTSRAKIAASKLIYCLLNAAVIWIVYYVVREISSSWMLEVNQSDQEFMNTFAYEFPAEVAAAGALLFGVAWFASSVLDSPTLAMGSSVLVLVVLLVLIQLVRNQFGWEGTSGSFDPARITLFWTLGVAAVVGGFICFIRRVEP